MHINKVSKIAAAVSLAAALSACGAGGNEGNGGNGGGNGGGSPNAAEVCAGLDGSGNNTGLTPPVQGFLCDLTDGIPGVSAVNDVLNGLLEGTPLEQLISQINDLTPAELTELLNTLLGADGALAPLTSALNAILVALLADQDPAAIAEALQGLVGGLGGGGSDGPTGTPLDALLALGGDGNPLGSLLGALGLGDSLPGLPGGGDGGNGGDGAGLISSVQDVLANLGDDSAIAELTGLISALVDPDGQLGALTSALNDLTNVEGGPLGPLTELVNGLVAADEAALAPLILGLNAVLGGLASGELPDPSTLTDLLGGLGGGDGGGSPLDQLTGLLGNNPLTDLLGGLGLPIPGIGGGDGGAGGDGDGVISTVQDTVAALLGGTPAEPLQDLLDTLLDPSDGALEALTGVLDSITTDPEALAQLNQLVEALAGEPDSALAPLLDGLNSLLGGAGGGDLPIPDLADTPLAPVLCLLPLGLCG